MRTCPKCGYEFDQSESTCRQCGGESPVGSTDLLGIWHVYQINDCDWWLARSMDEAKEAAKIRAEAIGALHGRVRVDD